jgi:hypothetical protein
MAKRHTLEIGQPVFHHTMMADLPHGTKIGTLVGKREAITCCYGEVLLEVPWDLMKPGDTVEIPWHHLRPRPL